MHSSPAKKEKKTTTKAAVGKKAVSTLSSPDKVVEAISNGILMRRYGPGHRLVEADLATKFNVSRGTVREALKKLAAQGVILLSPHRGASIRPLSRHEAEQLLLVLAVLCGLAARLATQNISHGTAKARIKAATDLLANSKDGGVDQFLLGRAGFYSAIFDIADNAELSRVMPMPQIQLLRNQHLVFLQPKDIKDMRKEYADIGAAILKGDAALAETRMRKHLSNTLDRLTAIDEGSFNKNS